MLIKRLMILEESVLPTVSCECCCCMQRVTGVGSMEDSIYVCQLLFSNCSKLYEAGFFAVNGLCGPSGLQSLGVFAWLVIAGLVFDFGNSIASFWSPAWSPNRDAKAVVLKTCPRCCSLQLAVQQMVSFGLSVLGLYLAW
ncbi:hypothetical protein Nepgr_026593 [Nepenthes gracilis]|uniref:Uncharacterized protein n=1 Tax=Nepenthes gracilis TaxID=150966 RepID=A0AAD3Y264_NEPGR|nr:hypothetical protein Nepgr_026593 [Nepenthes gracilis]